MSSVINWILIVAGALLILLEVILGAISGFDFLLIGSANLLLMEQVSETLAGRALYLDLPPFCPAEWLQRKESLQPLDRLFATDFDLREWPDETGDWPGWLAAMVVVCSAARQRGSRRATTQRR